VGAVAGVSRWSFRAGCFALVVPRRRGSSGSFIGFQAAHPDDSLPRIAARDHHRSARALTGLTQVLLVPVAQCRRGTSILANIRNDTMDMLATKAASLASAKVVKNAKGNIVPSSQMAHIAYGCGE
jgi:hypothetical protein